MDNHWAFLFMVGITLGAHIDVSVGKYLEKKTKAVRVVTHGFKQTHGKHDLPYFMNLSMNTVEFNGRGRAVTEEAAFYKKDSLSKLTRKKRAMMSYSRQCGRHRARIPQHCLHSFVSAIQRRHCRRRQAMVNGRCQRVSRGSNYEGPTRTSTNCRCGLAKRDQERILGGMETDVNEYPWMVGIVEKNESIVWCGGSLISNKWVLSAAHCMKKRTAPMIQALLGEHDTTSSWERAMYRKDIRKIVNHPGYIKRTIDYDFTLLKLKTSIDFSSVRNIRPICLPENDDKDYATYDAIITGWGRTDLRRRNGSDNLMETTLSVLSNSDCNNNYDYEPSRITDQMMCTHVQGGGIGSCDGDSGGPVITSGAGNGLAPGQNYELIGVVSWGLVECAENPGVNARVSKQLEWIREITRSGWTTCPRV